MKRIFTPHSLFVILLILFSTAINKRSFGQETRYYELSGETLLQECDVTGNIAGFKIINVKKGSKFTIVDIQNDYYIIRFWAWDTTGYYNLSQNKDIHKDKLNKAERSIVNKYSLAEKYNFDSKRAVENLKYFRILKSSLEFYATKIIRRWSPTVGSVALPFKYRYQNGEFKKDLSISSLVGWKRALNSSGSLSLTPLIGIGLSSVNLDSTNTDGKITTAEDRSAVTLSFGVVYQWQRLQIGIFTGYDWLTTSNTANWRYNGKNWLSIGVGISIFTETSAATEESKND